MPFTKGNKLGKGRPKGSKNKSTEIVKDVYAKALTESTDKLLNELNALTGADYIKAYISISKFIIPTLQSKSVEATISAKIPEWVNRLDEASDEDIDKLLEGNDEDS